MHQRDTEKNQTTKVTFQNGTKIVSVQLDLQRLVRKYIFCSFLNCLYYVHRELSDTTLRCSRLSRVNIEHFSLCLSQLRRGFHGLTLWCIDFIDFRLQV